MWMVIFCEFGSLNASGLEKDIPLTAATRWYGSRRQPWPAEGGWFLPAMDIWAI